MGHTTLHCVVMYQYSTRFRKVKDLNGNASFVGFDEVTGEIYRLDINKRMTGRANHIRSIFKISPEQYNKIKLAEPRVLQPSSTALPEGGRKTMTIASFICNVAHNDEKSSRQSVDTRAGVVRYDT